MGGLLGAGGKVTLWTFHGARFGIKTAKDSTLPGEPEYTLMIEGGCVQVCGAALLGQRKKLDGAGRGIHPRDCVLPAFGDPGGAVGADDHAVGRCTRPQRDQIRLASFGIEPAEFAGRLCCEPHHTIRAGSTSCAPAPASTGKVR